MTESPPPLIDERAFDFMASDPALDVVESMPDPQAWVLIYRIFRYAYERGYRDREAETCPTS